MQKNPAFTGKVVSSSKGVLDQLNAIFPNMSVSECQRKAANDVMTGQIVGAHSSGEGFIVKNGDLRYIVKRGTNNALVVVGLENVAAQFLTTPVTATLTVTDHVIALLSDGAKAEAVTKLKATDRELRHQESFLIDRIVRAEQELAGYRKELAKVQTEIVTNDKTLAAFK